MDSNKLVDWVLAVQKRKDAEHDKFLEKYKKEVAASGTK